MCLCCCLCLGGAVCLKCGLLDWCCVFVVGLLLMLLFSVVMMVFLFGVLFVCVGALCCCVCFASFCVGVCFVLCFFPLYVCLFVLFVFV